MGFGKRWATYRYQSGVSQMDRSMKAVWTCENAGIGLLTQQAHDENSPAALLTPGSLISAF
jgi:hypothetical protein